MANPLEAEVALTVKVGATSLSAELLIRSAFGVVADVESVDGTTIVSGTFRVDYMSVDEILTEVRRRIGNARDEYDGVGVTLWFPNFNPPLISAL